MKKVIIVSSIIATAAIIAVGLAAYSAKGNQEAQIFDGKLMTMTSTKAEVTTITCRNLDDYEKAIESGLYTYVNYEGASLDEFAEIININRRYGRAG